MNGRSRTPVWDWAYLPGFGPFDQLTTLWFIVIPKGISILEQKFQRRENHLQMLPTLPDLAHHL